MRTKGYRFFECHCGHKLRFGAARCGYCASRTAVKNRREFWLVSGSAVALVVGWAVTQVG